MKYVLTQENINIPNGVEIKTQSKNIEVKGPLGVLKRNFKHVPLDIKIQTKKDKKRVALQMWLANKKQKSLINTVSSHIANLIRGVTTGYKYKMVLAYSHFPTIINIIDKGAGVEIKNFLGERIVRTIKCLPGVIISRNEDEKNVITLIGTDLENLSLTCALIHQSVLVKNKDIRQFLDGIYVSEKRLEMKD